ncbi:MAG: butanol dehydrogenase, partial [Anaerovoracaceae bacterium]
NAMYLPFVIQYNQPEAEARYGEIAKAVGLEGKDDKELTEKLVAKIDALNVRLNIPKTMQEFGVKEEEFLEKVAKFSALAVGDACTGSNPRKIDPAQMEKLFRACFYGTKVDF